MDDLQAIKIHILRKLYRTKAFRKGHLLEETILKGIPRRLWHKGRFVLRTLVNIGMVKIYGKTRRGIAYQ